jgi:hypothetical protein
VKVSGHITFETVTSFLSDFHHKDREDVDVEAVFLHPDEPELEFQGFLKKQYPRVRYYQVRKPCFMRRKGGLEFDSGRGQW